jgi:transposase-like protein
MKHETCEELSMAKRKRRKFTAEFKADAVRLCTGGRSIGQVATELDLTETALREWVRRSEADAGKGNPEVLTERVNADETAGWRVL